MISRGGDDFRYLYALALFLCLLAPIVGDASIYLTPATFLFSFFIALVGRGKINSELTRVIFPLFVVVCIGLHGVADFDQSAFFKDVWYFSKPILIIGFGFLAAAGMRDRRLFWQIVITSASICAIVYLSRFVISPQLFNENVKDLRDELGHGFYIIPLGLAIKLAEIIGRPARKRSFLDWGVAVLLMAALVLSYSRTMWLSFFILLAVQLGWWGKINAKATLLLLGVLVGAGLIWGAGLAVIDTGRDASFLEKVIHSFREVSIASYSDASDINQNWRGYESARGLSEFLAGSPFQKLFGYGFGKAVDLALYIDLGGNDIRYAPILHNGYIYLLVKTGVTGLILYCLSLVFIVRARIAVDSRSMNADPSLNLRVGMGWVLGVATFFVTGLYNKYELDPIIITLGGAIFYAGNIMKRRIVR